MEYINCTESDILEIIHICNYLSECSIIDSKYLDQIILIKSNNLIDDNNRYCPQNGFIDISDYPQLNARVISPINIEDKYIIIIKKEILESIASLHTVAHEIIHVIDMIEYSKVHGVYYYFHTEECQREHYFHEFMFWTEFHAKRVGTFVYAIKGYEIYNDGIPPEDGVYTLESVDYQTSLLEKIIEEQPKNDISEISDWINKCLLEFSSYLGRLSIFDNGE